ncbi:MAG: PAS domain-containing sensor histidine kinase [Candidatus Thermoplasmatota archaeon]
MKKQEEKYRSIFEQFQDLYYKADLEGNIQELSPSVKPLSGYTRDELIGEPVSKVYSDPEDRAEMLDELVENGEVKGYEIKLEKKSGEKTVVSVNSHLIKDEDGEIKGIEGTIRDITEKKEAEEALEEEKKRYETLFEENPESVVEVNEDYRIEKVNERFEKLFGYEEEEIIGKKLDDLLVSEDKMEEAKKLNKKSKREGYFDYETVRLTRDGDEVNVSITGRPIEYDGKIRHLAVYRDITERKEAEEREKFLHSLLRHDIKNKSQAVQGFLQLLEEKKLSEDSRELVEEAIKANKESVNLIQKVRLLLSAQEEEKKPVNIASTIQDAVRANQGLAKKEGIDLSVECPSSECKVEGGSLLDEVFYNIIENSINHSEGSKIKISGEVTDEEVICSIEDDGIGIPEDKKETIFEKGYTTDEDRGTGLGLFLVKNLLKSYGGSVEVNDSDMGGTRFDVRLKKISQG